MRYLFFIITLLISSSISGGKMTSDYFFCSQLGHINKAPVFAISNIIVNNYNNNTHNFKDKVFEKILFKRTNKTFKPYYGAQCLVYKESIKAKKAFKKAIERAKKLKFNILKITFKQEDNHETKNL